MRTITFVAGVWFAVWTQSAWAACDDALMARLNSANLTAEQKGIICGGDKEKPVELGIPPSSEKPAKTGSDLEPKLESHYPTSVGFTKDNDDYKFLDANISLRYPLMYREITDRGCKKLFGVLPRLLPYFAFNGRFGFYISTPRKSNPVVLKAFNPELFVRFFLSTGPSSKDPQKTNVDEICDEEGDLAYHNDRQRQHKYVGVRIDEEGKGKNTEEVENRLQGLKSKQQALASKLKVKAYLDYLDVHYGHLSNGQGVTENGALTTLAGTLGGKNPNESMEFAKDYISRGWDYYGFAYTKTLNNDGDSLYLRWDHYVGGFLQQNIEENPWEAMGSSITMLRQVSGLKARYVSNADTWDTSFVATLTTGTKTPFKYNTIRLEAVPRWNFLDLPINFWVQQGYLSDLAQCYKPVRSYGIAAQFSTSNNH